MRKRWLSLVLTFAMLVSMYTPFTLTVAAATAPTKLWVSASEANGIPSQIDVFVSETSTATSGSWGNRITTNTHTCLLCLPGNTNPADCFLSWDGDIQPTVDNTSYDSGSCPVPSKDTQKSYTFTNGRTKDVYNITTYQGSLNVQRVFIVIDESDGKPTIAQMDADEDHNTECSGTININGQWYELSKMKGRGNASWLESKDKKPYNITLGSKINFPGVNSDKTKKWSFLAEVLDHSLLCNRSGYHLAYELGIGQDTTSADVWMNGEYQGCYTVTPKTDSFVTKDGYMIEQDNYLEPSVAEGGDPQFKLDGLEEYNGSWSSVYNRITVKKMGDNLLLNNGVVDESSANMEAAAGRIQSWLQDAWDAIRSSNGKNSKGKYYTDYIDIESFAKMYLMHEYVKSYDVCAGSILFHRDGSTDSDKLFAGPLWDLDNAMGSVYNNDLLGNSAKDRRSGEGSFIPVITEYKTSIYKTISKHADFMEEVYRQYNRHRDKFDNLSSDTASMISEIEASARMNHYKVQDLGHSTGKNNHYYGSATTIGSGQYRQNYLATTNSKTDWGNYAQNLMTYITTRSLWFHNTYYDENYVCEHEYEDVVTPPTCTAEGYTTHICKYCGDSYQDPITIPKIAHDYQDGVCTVCHEVLLQAIISCSDGASVTVYETQDPNGAYVENAASANPRNSDTGLIDCAGDGQINFVVNLVPGYELVSVTAEPAESFKNLKLPADTGIENGYRITKVKGNLTITVTSRCLHSNLTAHEEKDATCTEAGSSAYWSCDTCSKYFSDAEGQNEIEVDSWVIPATGHSYGELVAKKEAGCTEEGMKAHYQCSVCHKYFDADKKETTEEDLTIAATGHNLTAYDAVEATCTEAGNSAYWSCDKCSKYFSDAEGQNEIEAESWVIPAIGHRYGELVAKKEANCTENGMEAHYQCSVCQKYFDADKKATTEEDLTISATGHSYGELVAKKEASCTENGMEAHYQCSVCHKYFDADKKATTEEDLTIAATGHNLTAYDAVEATCTEEGNSAYWSCDKCSKYFSDAEGQNEIEAESWVIPATGHNYGELVAKKEANCTENGMEAHYQCSVCQKYFDADKKETTKEALTIAVKGHKWDKPDYTWSDNNSKVTATHICTVCAKKESETVDTTYSVVVEATEMTAGTGRYTSDAFENEAFEAQTKDIELSPTGYKVDYIWTETESGYEVTGTAVPYAYGAETITEKVEADYKVTIEPTCTKNGVGTWTSAAFVNRQFSVQTKTIVLEQLDHNWTEPSYSWSTDNSKVTAAHICKQCGNEETEEIQTVAQVTKEANCEEKGETTYTAEFTNPSFETRTRTVANIDALGHDYKEVEESAKAATCTEAGKEEDRVCSRCGDKVTGRTIEALGHTEVDIPAVAATCTKTGLTAGKKCSSCGKILIAQEKIPAKGHTEVVLSAVEPTCIKKGFTSGKKCSACGEILEAQKEISALGHSYKEVKDSAVAATCTEAGKEADQKCSRCGEVIEGKTIKSKGHVWNEEYTIDKEATKSTEGLKSIHCSICDEIKPESSLPIDKLEPAGQKNGAQEQKSEAEIAAEAEIEALELISKGIYSMPVSKGLSLTTADQLIVNAASDEGPAGTEYGLIKLRSSKQTKRSVTIKWTQIKNAEKYVIYGNKCGKTRKMKKLTTVTGKTKTFKKIAGKKVKKGTYYKFLVVALDKNDKVISTSKVVHATTKGGKAGNHKRVTIQKSVLKKAQKLKTGMSLKLKAKAVKPSKRKVKVHRKVAYESSSPEIAVVSKKGVVTAKKSGTCYIYAYAQDGVYKKIKVVVQ